jgi:predicted TIM-barrel fold metal-dependent hydrolase
VYFDIGLTIPHVGLGSGRILAESLEVAPFSKLLYSSDAARLPELYYMASCLFREAASAVFGGWVAADLMSEADAGRFVTLIGSENARRVYLGSSTS